MSKGQSLQDPFLNALRRERIPVAINHDEPAAADGSDAVAEVDA